MCSGFGTLEESQEKCVSRPDKERGRKKDDGKSAGPRGRLAEAEEFQDLQGDSRRQVHPFFCILYSYFFVSLYSYFTPIEGIIFCWCIVHINIKTPDCWRSYSLSVVVNGHTYIP